MTRGRVTADLRSPASVNSTMVTLFGNPSDKASACIGSRFPTNHQANPMAATPEAIKNDLRPIELGTGVSSLFKESTVTSRVSILSEGKSKGSHAGIKKFNFECPIFDFPFLPDQLIEPVFLHHSIALFVSVAATIFPGRAAIDPHTEPHRLPVLPGT